MMQTLVILRLDRGLSAEQLAQEIGIDGKTLRNVESGATQPHPATAKKIADYFGMKPTELFPPRERSAA